jgi:hypothetical protein
MHTALSSEMPLGDWFASGQAANASEALNSVAQAWRNCLDVLTQGSRVMNEDLTQYILDGKTVLQHVTALSTALNSLRDALENRDYVLLNDVAQYEFAPMGEAWQRVLDDLADQIERV